MRHALGCQRPEMRPEGLRPGGHGQPVGKSDRTRDLRFQKPHQVAVAHRSQRVILHRALGKRLLPDKQVTHEDRAAILGKGRAVDGLVRAEVIHERLGHRTDISLCRAVESRAVLPEESLGTGSAKPGQRGAAFANRLIHRGCPAFQGDDFKRRCV